jgi:hypothetical protein
MSGWDRFGELDFADAVGNIQAAMSEGRRRELDKRRNMGLAAYIAAHEARSGGRKVRRGEIVNSFAAMLGLEAKEL